MGGGGACVLIMGPRQPSRRAACVRGEGEGAGKVVEQQLGNPCSSFSSPSPLLCIRRGFDKNLTLGNAIQYVKIYVRSPFDCCRLIWCFICLFLWANECFMVLFI